VRETHERPIIGGRIRLGFGKHFLQRTQHQRQRCAELVTDVRKELGLRTVDLRKRLSALAFFFVRPGIRYGRCQVSGDEIEKAAIRVVERTARIDARN